MDTDGIIHIAANESEWIVFAKVLFCGEGNLTDIIDRIDRIGRDAILAQALLVERRFQGNVDRFLEFLNLQLLELLSWHGL